MSRYVGIALKMQQKGIVEKGFGSTMWEKLHLGEVDAAFQVSPRKRTGFV